MSAKSGPNRGWRGHPPVQKRTGSGGRRPRAAPDLDALDATEPERLRECRRGGPGRQDIVHDRDAPDICRPATDGERACDVCMAFRHASGLRLRRRVPTVDADTPRPRQAERSAGDGGQLLRVIESAVKEPSPGDGQTEHHGGHREAGARCDLAREQPPERGGRRKLPAILHAMDETAERRRKAPGCDHSIEGRRLIEARRARRGDGAVGRRRVRGGHGKRSRAARADGAEQQHLQGAFAVGARVQRNPDLAAKAARPRKEPVQRRSGRALISRSLQHRRLARSPWPAGRGFLPPVPERESDRSDRASVSPLEHAVPAGRDAPPGGGHSRAQLPPAFVATATGCPGISRRDPHCPRMRCRAAQGRGGTRRSAGGASPGEGGRAVHGLAGLQAKQERRSAAGNRHRRMGAFKAGCECTTRDGD